jgi:tripartite-type tricarboxylate transporter receptor subunit TctC
MTSRATKVSRRSILGTVAALGAGLGQAHGQEQPAGGTLRWLVPFAPGGGSDMAARIVAVELSKILNQPVVVDNRPGGNTNIAVQALMSARPDGNTIMSASNDTLTINPHLYNVPYQAERDFEYVALLIKFPHLLVARKDFPAENARDAIDYIRSQGPSLAFATFGVGSVAHMGMEMLLKRIGATATPAWCMDRAGDRLGIGWGLPLRERAPPCPSRRTPTGGIEFRGSSTGSRIGLRTRRACVPAAA